MTTATGDTAGPVLDWRDPLAVSLTAAVQRGDVDGLRHLLAKDPRLARARVVKTGESAGSRTLLHLFADWPGQRRNADGIVAVLCAAGADPDQPILPVDAAGEPGEPSGATETPLHWAASNDDVALVEALLGAGADIEAVGSVFGGGGPLVDAVCCRSWRAARLLVERGARPNLFQAAALGMRGRVDRLLAAEPAPGVDAVTTAFWAACTGDQREIAELLLDRGADINWVGWGNDTPLDVARHVEADDLARWLEEHGGRSAPTTAEVS
jgi:uncharacterized protein